MLMVGAGWKNLARDMVITLSTSGDDSSAVRRASTERGDVLRFEVLDNVVWPGRPSTCRVLGRPAGARGDVDIVT